MTDSKNELKPCPFCGSFELELNAIPNVAQFIQCKRCKAKGPYWTAGTSARKIWNTRATSQAERQIEAIRSVMAIAKRDRENPNAARLYEMRHLYNEIARILEEGNGKDKN